MKTGTTKSSHVTRYSEYPLGPFAISTGVLPAMVADGIAGRPSIAQMSARPLRQFAHDPHCGVIDMTTWSPTCTRFTCAPISSTMPAPPWPATLALATMFVVLSAPVVV